MSDLEKRVVAIETRNARVELEKAWEVSWARRLSIALLTYIVISIFLITIHKPQPFINAFVPPIGYLMSTLVMRQVKDAWETRMKPIFAKKAKAKGEEDGQVQTAGKV